MFRLEGVKYKEILDIEELFIPAGMVTSIVGESGSGKTTLLKLLNKLISPDSGSIYFHDRPLTEADSIEHRRNVVMLPQAPAIFPGTIRDNLLIGLKFAEKPAVPAEALTEILGFLSLPKHPDEDTGNLSGGEKQRVALGRVILLDPQVYLLDEPSSSLDEDTELVIIDKMVRHVREKGKSLIMVTHARKIAQTFSDRIIGISQGREVAVWKE